MNPLPITAKQIIRTILIFVGVIIGFGVLSGTIGWPDQQNWGLAVLAALVIALLPVVGPILNFLQESGAVVDIRGVKLDFSKAPRRSDAEPGQENLQVDPGLMVNDSNAASIAETAVAARDAEILVVDLGSGKSWFLSRLYALAAAARTLDGASVIVLLYQRGGVKRHLLGWLQTRDVILALTQDNPQYEKVLRRAKEMLNQLQLKHAIPSHVIPQALVPDVDQLTTAYKKTGDLAIVPALIRELQKQPQPTDVDDTLLEDPNTPNWLSGRDADRLFDPWLVRDRLSMDITDQEAKMTLAQAGHRFVSIEKNGQYEGMIDIDAYVRHLVLQPARRD